jgi:hypothetical protein
VQNNCTHSCTHGRTIYSFLLVISYSLPEFQALNQTTSIGQGENRLRTVSPEHSRFEARNVAKDESERESHENRQELLPDHPLTLQFCMKQKPGRLVPSSAEEGLDPGTFSIKTFSQKSHLLPHRFDMEVSDDTLDPSMDTPVTKSASR